MGGGILFVCHANLCRSPLAEYLAREMLADELKADAAAIPVSSAGTHAVPGQLMHPHAARLATERDLDPAPFRSRPVTAADLTRAGLILVATRQQRSICVSLAPRAVRRTFTLRQFARLVTTAAEHGWRAVGDRPPAERVSAMADTAGRARSLLQPVPAAADDLADPIGKPLAEFRQCAAQIELALAPVVRFVTASY